MNARQTYQEQIEPQLREWASKIDDLQTKAEAAKGETQTQVREKLTELRVKQDEAKRKLESLKRASDDAWTDIKVGLDRAVEDLKQGVNSAISNF